MSQSASQEMSETGGQSSSDTHRTGGDLARPLAQSPGAEPLPTALLLGIVLAGFALRLAYLLNSHPFIDEFTTILAARAIWQHGLPVLPSGLFYEHGLLFSYLDTPFVGLEPLAGEKALFIAARLPSLLIGTVTIPLLYRIGRQALSPWVGLMAAALLAFSPEGMVWGGRARMYALAQLLVLVLGFLVYEGSRGKGRARLRWVALVVLLATLLTQFGAIVLVPPLVVGALVIGWLTRPAGTAPWFWRRVTLVEGAALAAVIGLAVWIKRLGQPLGAPRLGTEGIVGTLAELWNTISYQAGLALNGRDALEFVARQFGVPHHIWLTVVAVAGGLAALALWIYAGRGAGTSGGGSHWTLYLWLIVGLPVVEMVTLLEPWRRNPRYLVMILPWFYLLVAAGLYQISNLKGQIPNDKGQGKESPLRSAFGICYMTFVISLVGLQAYGTWVDLGITYRTPEPAYEEAFQHVADGRHPGDAVLTMNTSAAGLILGDVDYFAIQQDAEQFLLNAPHGEGEADDMRPVDRWMGAPWVGTAADLNRVLDEHRRAWFVVDTIRLPVYYRADWLATVKTQMELVWSGDGALVYRTRPDRSRLPTSPSVEVGADLGGVVRLIGYHDPQTSAPEGSADLPLNGPGSVYRVTLFWSGLAHTPTDYTVFVHVRDVDGMTVAQQDSQPLDGDYPTSQWGVNETVIDVHNVELPPDLPPGQYGVWVGMYQMETMERLPVEGDTWGENAVPLGTIIIP
jgi:hypothetical protein